MRKRPSTTAAVSSINQHEQVQPKKIASIGKKKRPKRSFAVPILSLFILLAGVLLLHSSWFNGPADSLSEGEKVAAFVDWFTAAGGHVSDKIAIETFPEMGRGVIALQSVEEKDELLFVPKSIIICYDTISKEWHSQPKLKKKLVKLRNDQEELLTAFLLLEQAKSLTSPWTPYLQILPSISSRHDVASPLLFENDEEIEALQDERMVKAAKSERQRVKKAHGRFKRLFRSFVTDDDALELSRYLWAWFLVNSRAFSIQGQRVLVPFGDIFNGEPDDNTRQHDNGHRFLEFHDLQPEGMTIQADRGTLKGKQLFEDYGDNSNYVYFLHHGFLMGDRGFDCAAFRLPPLADAKEEADTLASKSQVLSRVRVDDSPMVCISRSGKLEDPGLVRIYTALYYMDAAQATACNNAKSFSECFPPEVMSDFEAEPGQQEISLLLYAIRQHQERYPTIIQDDLVALNKKNGSAGSNSIKHAVSFRLSRKQILRDAQVVLKQHLEEEVEARGISDKFDSVIELGQDEAGSGSNKLERFQQWITHHFPVNHLQLQYINEAMGYGTFATKPLSRGEVYLKVPVQFVMNVRSALKSRWVSGIMFDLQTQHTTVSREEMLLLLHLLEEKFGPNHLRSHWKPYLDMLPVLDEQDNTMGSPLFYDEDEEQLKLLEGTDLHPLVTNYRQRVSRSYSALSDHLELSPWVAESRFRWASAILDSRSIWWNGQRHLVPLLDMVNCQELNSQHKPHHTSLDSSGRHAVTKASWDFEAGQQVVENYAQPNYIYLLYHGFVLDSNSHDCAHFHIELPATARQHKFSTLLRSLEIYSWTPDICVSSTDNLAVKRFSKIALLVSDPNKVLQLLGNAAATSPPPEAISSASKLTEERLNRLQASEPETSSAKDFRTQSILKYRQQQLHHLTTLRNKLQQLPVQQQ